MILIKDVAVVLEAATQAPWAVSRSTDFAEEQIRPPAERVHSAPTRSATAAHERPRSFKSAIRPPLPRTPTAIGDSSGVGSSARASTAARCWGSIATPPAHSATPSVLTHAGADARSGVGLAADALSAKR